MYMQFNYIPPPISVTSYILWYRDVPPRDMAMLRTLDWFPFESSLFHFKGFFPPAFLFRFLKGCHYVATLEGRELSSNGGPIFAVIVLLNEE